MSVNPGHSRWYATTEPSSENWMRGIMSAIPSLRGLGRRTRFRRAVPAWADRLMSGCGTQICPHRAATVLSKIAPRSGSLGLGSYTVEQSRRRHQKNQKTDPALALAARRQKMHRVSGRRPCVDSRSLGLGKMALSDASLMLQACTHVLAWSPEG